MLNHQKLRCYQHMLEVLTTLQRIMPSFNRWLRDQITRAASSVCLNLSEGCGKLTPKDKKRFFAIARGSVLEVSGALDVASALGLIPKQSHQDFQHKLLIITKMISALIKKT
jgi:four helix bundle protein